MTGRGPASPRERGYSTVDLLMGITLLALMMVVVYRVFLPTLALSRNTDERLVRQQDVRLALDRLARDLHETSQSFGRLRLYTTGCTGAYEGCVGFASARPSCSGAFQLAAGRPAWQAVVYLWRDVASNELRRRCDATTPFLVTSWPPTLAPFETVAREVVQLSITQVPAGIEVRLRERAPRSSQSAYRYQTEFQNLTVFVPQNQ